MSSRPEVWLRGPVPGFEPLLLPAAHALLQVKEEVRALEDHVPAHLVWARPGEAASIGFHVRHIGGSLDRLLTYARGEQLTEAQRLALAAEEVETNEPLGQLGTETRAAIDRALEQQQRTSREELLVERRVGRGGLPSTTIGLLFHAAEHATRHAGQALTTLRILSGAAALIADP